MYNVVLRMIAEHELKGTLTWTAYRSKAHFDRWYDKEARSMYEVVEEGITVDRVEALCSSPEATLADLATINQRVKSMFGGSRFSP